MPLSPRIAQLKKMAEDNKTLQARNALRTFLQEIHILQEDMRADLVLQHKHAYQVFLSYAWGADGDARFEGLRRLLRAFYQDLTEAGMKVWFDEKHMVGDIDAQMRQGVASSDLVLLFGTEVYRNKTQVDSKTNVKKELDFALEQHKANPGFLIPLLLEGKAKEIFSAPGLGYSQIIVDATQWSGLDQEQYATRQYIHALTTFQNSVGILPAAIGLPQTDRKYRSRYETCEKALQADLEKIYAVHEEKEVDQGLVPSVNPLPAAQLLPVVAAAPQVSAELAGLQEAVKKKEEDITAFLDKEEVESKAELLTRLEHAQKTPGKFQQKKIEDAQRVLEDLRRLEAERDTLEKQIRKLTGVAEPLIDASAARAAIKNSKGAGIVRVKNVGPGVRVVANADDSLVENSDGACIIEVSSI